MAKKLLLLALLATTMLRWVWCHSVGLSAQECYLALCGAQPAAAYFDGPPGTALCVAAGLSAAGTNGLGAALLWPLFAVGATLALVALVSPIAGRAPALALATLLNVLPAFNAAAISPGASLPTAMASLAFLACVWRALQQRHSLWWLAAGLCAAGAALFSYVAWILWGAILCLLLTSRRWRSNIGSPFFWISVVPSLIVLATQLHWNAEHGWVHFIGGTWDTVTTLHLGYLPGAIWDAAVAASPVALVALLLGIVGCLRSIAISPKARYLAIPTMLALTLAIYLQLRDGTAGTAGLLFLILAVPCALWFPGGTWPAAIARKISAMVLLATSVYTAVWLALAPPGCGASLEPEAASAIEALRMNEGSQTFLIAEDAPLASALALHLADKRPAFEGHPPVYVVESPCATSQYALWPGYDAFVDAPAPSPGADPFTEQDGTNPFLGRSALYVTTQPPAALPQAIGAAFASCQLLAEITTGRGTVLRVYRCTDYQTLPL